MTLRLHAGLMPHALIAMGACAATPEPTPAPVVALGCFHLEYRLDSVEGQGVGIRPTGFTDRLYPGLSPDTLALLPSRATGPQPPSETALRYRVTGHGWERSQLPFEPFWTTIGDSIEVRWNAGLQGVTLSLPSPPDFGFGRAVRWTDTPADQYYTVRTKRTTCYGFQGK